MIPSLPHLFAGTSERNGRLIASVPASNYFAAFHDITAGVFSGLIVGPASSPPPGAKVLFSVDGVRANEAIVWESGAFTKGLTLTFSSTPPIEPPVATGSIKEAIDTLISLLNAEVMRLRTQALRLEDLLDTLEVFDE